MNLPVGLIEASWGGTPAEVWTPKDSIENNAVLKIAADSLKVSDYWPVNAAATFNAMINPDYPLYHCRRDMVPGRS